MKKYIKIIIKSIILLILVTFATFFIKISIDINNALTYSQTGNIDYKVYLRENEFYKEEYLEENMTYITNLIDYVELDFHYDFLTSDKTQMDYKYSVLATLLITPDNNTSKELFKEEYVIKEETSRKISNLDKYSIEENTIIDYNFYNDIVNSFKSTYGLSCNGELIVELKVDTNGQDTEYGTNFNESNNMKMTFSLAKKQVDINTNLANIDETVEVDRTIWHFIKNKGYFAIGIMIAVLGIIDIILIGRDIYLMIPKKDGYTKYVDKIRNDYDRAIVETSYLPNLNLKKYEVIEVGKFDELMDVRDTLKLPILYVPKEEQESCFYIKKDNTIYIHYVKCNSLMKI